MKTSFFKKNFVYLLTFFCLLFFIIFNARLVYKINQEKRTALLQDKISQEHRQKDIDNYKDAKILGNLIRKTVKEHADILTTVKPECLKVPYSDPSIGATKTTEKNSNLIEYYYFAQVFGYQEEKVDNCDFVVIELATVNKNEAGEQQGQKFYLTFPKDFKDEEDKFLPTVFNELQNQRRVALYVTYEINKETEFLKLVSWHIETFFIH